MPSNARPYSRRRDRVVLERWQFSLKPDILSNVYKKCIPVFRSIVAFSKIMPTAKYLRGLAKKSGSATNNPALKLRYRILNQVAATTASDSLGCALYPGHRDVLDTYTFGRLDTPVGELCATVTYRQNCEFRVDDAEAMLSSHFMAMDDHYFKPSLGRNDSQIVGSAPTSNRETPQQDDADQTYGSLSTFHTFGPKPSSSPLTALRAVADATVGSPSLPSQKIPPSHRLSQDSRAPETYTEGAHLYQRRPSITFQPFKAGSLASSPASGMMAPPLSPGTGSGRAPGPATLTHRRGPSLTTLPQAILRTPNLHAENAVASSTSSSPKPAPINNRYSSSFSHRRSRFSSGASKGQESGSSGKPSPSSSAQPGSDVLNDGQGEHGSSESVQKSDDENVKDFLKMLESKKELKTFSRNDVASQNAYMRRTTAALAKYRQMTQSTRELSDSLSSSLQKGSSGSSSRQLHNVPQMVGASVSTGSSPGKPISPHTPHTPAVPSRLSAVDYGEQPRRSRHSSRSRPQEREPEIEEDPRDGSSEAGRTETTAIPIPTSPRPWVYGRRSSSVSQRQHSRALEEDDEPTFAVNRSASLPTREERPIDLKFLLTGETPPLVDQDAEPSAAEDDLPTTGTSSRSEDGRDSEQQSSEEQRQVFQYHPSILSHRVYRTIPDPSPSGSRSRGPDDSLTGANVASSASQALRGLARYGASYSPSSSGQGAASTVADRFATSERGAYSARHSARSSTMAAPDDYEDGIFTMSELGGRRSLEEAKGDASGRRSTRGYSGRSTQ
jgi:autophagy-related protein 13